MGKARPVGKKYYIDRTADLLKKYDAEARAWGPFVHGLYGEIHAWRILVEARQTFEELIPQIPYIGGDVNYFTLTLLDAVRYLALYKAMKGAGKTAEETGKILYDATLSLEGKYQPPPMPERFKSIEDVYAWMARCARESQERRYPGDYVYEFVPGDGKKFDYGLNFTECAGLKFYRAQGAGEFMPYCCYLDFPLNKIKHTGLVRPSSMSLGHKMCVHRYRLVGETKVGWPPPFLKPPKKTGKSK